MTETLDRSEGEVPDGGGQPAHPSITTAIMAKTPLT
jgi:hypothetical protein